MTTGECVSFQNRRGETLHGILHSPPDAVARGICVLLLSPGIKGRIGPHRLYLKIADRIVRQGFHLLRFDFHGLGDSEGELEEVRLADVYNSIQRGLFVDDTIAAMDFVELRLGIQQFVGSGLCGGSITALLAAQRDNRIRSLLGIGLPVVLDGGEANRGRYLTTQQAREARLEFYGKLLHPSRWLKFLGGRSDYRVVFRVMRQAFRFSGDGKRKDRTVRADDPRDDTNPLFAPAMMELLRSRRPVLLIFSGADRLLAQFQEKFADRNCDALKGIGGNYRVHVIPGANHIMSDAPWTAEFLEVANNWLQEIHPA